MNYLNNLVQRTYPIVYGLLRMMMAALLVIAGIHAEASTTKFRANGGGGSYGNCDGMTCVSVSVNQGGTQSQPTTFLSYFINQNGPSTITYISGFGQIPNSAADVNGDARVTGDPE